MISNSLVIRVTIVRSLVKRRIIVIILVVIKRRYNKYSEKS